MNNINTSEIHGSRILILGFGREGKSVEAWLRKHYPTCSISTADEKRDGPTYLDHLSDFDTVIRSPGVSLYLPQLIAYRESGGYVTSATNIFFSLVKGKTIGITGTKGKSTTTSLIAHIISSVFPDVRLVGNIGNPMLDALDSSTNETIFVIELSSHQLADCRYSPHIAVLLGIVSEHLDYYKDLQTYAAAKANILRFQTKDDYLVFNPEHTLVRDLARDAKSTKLLYKKDMDEGILTFIRDGVIYGTNGKKLTHPIIPLSDVPLLGNIENVLAAITVCMEMNILPEQIEEAIRPFRSLPHRLEYAGEYQSIRFYNDSLATIPEATIHALESLNGDVSTLIAGGYDRHLDFTALGAYLRSHPVPTLILFPDTGMKIWESIGDVNPALPIAHFFVETMEEAIKLAYEHTPRGKICLLSPASASYNLFKNYEDRGDQFKSLAKKIGTI